MAFIVMVRKTAGKRTLGRPKMRWNGNVNIELRKRTSVLLKIRRIY
jgi:hypothetical protein